MIERKDFLDAIRIYKEHYDLVDNIDNILGCSMFESPLAENTFAMFDVILNMCFEEEAIDTIYWWLLEKDQSPNNIDLKMYDDKDNEIPMETLDNLWDYIKDFRK